MVNVFLIFVMLGVLVLAGGITQGHRYSPSGMKVLSGLQLYDVGMCL